MIMAVCEPGDKIIIPRNAHKAAVGGLILSGAQPIYIEPQIHPEFGISMGITAEAVEEALEHHPDVKAVFVVYPTYYGAASDLSAIVEVSHARNVPVVVDEAHGAHLAFHDALPVSAMECGADISASSTHKLAGSMTQSSILLLREGLVNPQKVKAVLNLTQSTSPSYVLMASLDMARKQMALRGKEILDKTLELTAWARKELAGIPGLELLDDNVIGKYGCVAFDPTKITLNVLGIGLSGYEMEKILRDQYRLQVELSDLYNVIFLVTIGDDLESVGYLVEAVQKIAANCNIGKVVKYCPSLPGIPELVVSPRAAFYSDIKFVPFQEAEGEICAEMIMAYPPGIPLVLPGERISRDIIDYVEVLKKENAELQGTEDPDINFIRVLEHRII
jgi:arginine/lysine/ornithine decarboxylase